MPTQEEREAALARLVARFKDQPCPGCGKLEHFPTEEKSDDDDQC